MKTEMKRYFLYITIGLMLGSVFMLSCVKISDEEMSSKDESQESETGTYYVEKTVNTYAETKGVSSSNTSFDMSYDPEYIYLHEIGSDEKLRLPVYNYECSQGNQCYGFRYQVNIEDDGSVTVIPFDVNRVLMDTKLILDSEGSCYFSSWDSDIWQLSKETQVENRGDYYFYKRQKDLNKEIYRSKEDFDVSELIANTSLLMTRVCGGFNLVGVFFDQSNPDPLDEEETAFQYTLSAAKFEEVMGSPRDEWYIKIYIGGSAFVDSYNIETQQTSDPEYDGGYYSSGDNDLFHSGSIDASKYLKFALSTYGSATNIYKGYGYYTSLSKFENGELIELGNHLFTPVLGNGRDASVYILIKHWTGGGDGPKEAWLNSDDGALQTKVKITGENGGVFVPGNNGFYTLGLAMDITQFHNAWEAAGGDAVVATKNGGVREFTLDDAITIFETDSF